MQPYNKEKGTGGRGGGRNSHPQHHRPSVLEGQSREASLAVVVWSELGSVPGYYCPPSGLFLEMNSNKDNAKQIRTKEKTERKIAFQLIVVKIKSKQNTQSIRTKVKISRNQSEIKVNARIFDQNKLLNLTGSTVKYGPLN